MNIREQKQMTIGTDNYIITAFDATYGLDVLAQVQKLGMSGESPSGKFLKDVILKSVTVNNFQLDDKTFDKHFSKKYTQMFQLFEAIISFNFGDENDPNGDSDTSE